MRTRVSLGGVGISQSEMTEGVRPGSASFYITTLTKHKVAAGMFSFARQKRTRKAPATFDAREARPGFHPGPQSGGRRDKIGRCAYGTDAFSDFAPTPIGKNAYRKQLQGGEKPSPSRLCRATSPERERLWQRRKVYRLSADFLLPLTNEDETCPLCQGLSLWESCRRRRLRGFVPEGNPLRHGFAVPPLPKGRGFGKGGKFAA